MMDALTKFDSVQAIKSATAADYTSFLHRNWGPAAATIEKNYPLSLFKSSPIGLVVAAIATIITDSEFKCAGYQGAVQAKRNNIPVWMYEFTHNSTCVWLDTMYQEFVSVYGTAHTAEIPYVFGNLHFDFANSNMTCTGTAAEWKLSNQMKSLWTAMAENGNPSTADIHWPEFQITPKGFGTPGMVFGNSSLPGSIDYHACALWDQVDDLLSNATVVNAWEAKALASASASAVSSAVASITIKPTASPSGACSA